MVADPHSSDEDEQLQSYLNIHLKQEEQSLPVEEQIVLLEKKNKKKWWLLAVNVAAILFFSYSFYYHITKLSSTLLYILAAVFVINIALIFYQKKQLHELIAYLKHKDSDAG